MPTSQDHLDSAGQRLLEDARGRWQRRRATIYCVFGAIINCLWLGSTVSEWVLADAPTFSDRLDVASTLLLGGLYVAAAIGFWRMRPEPEQVARRLGWVMMVAGMIVVVAVMLVLTYDTDLASPEFTPLPRSIAAAATALLFIFTIHFVAALFVALPPWPAFWPLLPIWIAYAAGILSLEGTPLGVRALLAGLFPLAGAPGLVWSVVCHRRWVDRFKIELLGDRYGKVRQDLVEARRVHEGIFPPPIADGELVLRYAYEPMREIGGDFLFARRPGDGTLLLVVVDVTGHGVASALAVTRIHAALSLLAGSDRRTRASGVASEAPASPVAGGGDALASDDIIRPGWLLTQLNAFVADALAPQGVFATAIALSVDPRNGELRWANAGHPPGIVTRADAVGSGADDALTELPSTCPMLGVLGPEEFEAQERVSTLAQGESIVLCTDGVLEAFGPDAAMFGMERLRDAIAAHSAAGPDGADLPQRIVDSVRDFRIGPPTDDTLVVEIRRR